MTYFNDLPRFLFKAPPETPSRVTFRTARAADLGPLHRACFTDRPLAQFGYGFRRSLASQRSGRSVHLVVVEDKQLIATGQLTAYGTGVEIADLAVAPVHRGKGLGTSLITVLARIAAFKGFDYVEICVMRENVRARTLYERLGFIADREFSLTEMASVVVLRKVLQGDWRDRPAEGVVHDA